MFAFATCNVDTAYEFISKFYDVEKDDIKDLLELIRQDKARVLDPDHHSTCQIILGKNGTESDIAAIRAACSKLSGGV